MLRWFPRFHVATTCFSCSPPDLNLVGTNILFTCKLPLPPGDSPIAVNKYYYYYYYNILFLNKGFISFALRWNLSFIIAIEKTENYGLLLRVVWSSCNVLEFLC